MLIELLSFKISTAISDIVRWLTHCFFVLPLSVQLYAHPSVSSVVIRVALLYGTWSLSVELLVVVIIINVYILYNVIYTLCSPILYTDSTSVYYVLQTFFHLLTM